MPFTRKGKDLRVCAGLRGFLFKSAIDGRNMTTGQALIDMLDGCQHRGPDSTGFALYGDTQGDQLRMRFFVGEGAEAEQAIAKIKALLDKAGAEIVEDEVIGNNYRVVANFAGDLQTPWPTSWTHAAKVISIGTSLEIIKDVGGAHEVDDTYHVQSFSGTHGLGHVRLATESDVKPEAAHPFWATGFADIAIVHNGQITNYWKMRRALEQRDYEFNTDNDSELIAVYLAEKLSQGVRLKEALKTSIDDLDGTFSFLVSTKDEIGYAKDRLAVKPMIMYETDDLIAIASEEVSLNKLFPGQALNTSRAGAGDLQHMAQIDLAHDPRPRGQRADPELRGERRGRRGHQPRRAPSHRRRPDGADHRQGARLGRLLLRGLDRRRPIRNRQQCRLGPRRQHLRRHGDRRRQCRRHRRRRHPRRRDRHQGQHGLALRPGHEGGHLAVLRQRQLHGRLHDVRRAHHHPRQLRRAGRRGHEPAARSTWPARSTPWAPTPRRSTWRATSSTTFAPSSTSTRSPSRGPSTRSSTPASACATARAEPQVRSIPFFSFSGNCGYWNQKVQEDVYIKSQIGRYRVRGYGGARVLPHMSDLAFRKPVRAATTPSDVVSQVEHGDRDRRHQRRRAPEALHAGDDRADELRRALGLDQAGHRHGLDLGRHRREHRRGRHVGRPAGRRRAAHLPVPGRSPGLEHPRHEAGERPGDLHLPRAPSPASAASSWPRR